MTVNRDLGCPFGAPGRVGVGVGVGGPNGEAETVNLVSSAGVGFPGGVRT